MKSNLIEPRTLKGFRDFLGDELKMRQKIYRIFEETFQKYGYEPLETPVLEYYDILAGKYGEEEKLIYNFEDLGGRRVGMRYDQTVPTARVYAQYKDKLPLPWRRYVIQKTWRAENTQKGRYREFYQCDIDIIGATSVTAEAEFIDIGVEVIKKLGFKNFRAKINNRKILNAVAEYAGRKDKFVDIVAAIDKWNKRSLDDTKKDLQERGLKSEEIDKVLECIELKGKTFYEKLDELEKKFEKISEGLEGISELKQIYNLVSEKDYLEYDPTIARALSYYTGPIWEWEVLDGEVGSIGGAGRYDKLIGSMLGEEIPATGESFGIERIIDVMKEKNMLLPEDETSDILVTIFSEEFLQKSYEVASEIRKMGLNVTLYPEVKPLKKQFEYADKKKIDWVVIIGEEEVKNDQISLKNMKSGEQISVSIEKLKEAISQ